MFRCIVDMILCVFYTLNWVFSHVGCFFLISFVTLFSLFSELTFPLCVGSPLSMLGFNSLVNVPDSIRPDEHVQPQLLQPPGDSATPSLPPLNKLAVDH